MRQFYVPVESSLDDFFFFKLLVISLKSVLEARNQTDTPSSTIHWTSTGWLLMLTVGWSHVAHLSLVWMGPRGKAWPPASHRVLPPRSDSQQGTGYLSPVSRYLLPSSKFIPLGIPRRGFFRVIHLEGDPGTHMRDTAEGSCRSAGLGMCLFSPLRSRGFSWREGCLGFSA